MNGDTENDGLSVLNPSTNKLSNFTLLIFSSSLYIWSHRFGDFGNKLGLDNTTRKKDLQH